MQIGKPRGRQGELLSEEVEEQRVIYDNSNQIVHRLNSTMSWIWTNCDGSRTTDDLIAAMRQSDTENEDARRLITSGLKQLADANLLEPESVDLSALVAQQTTVSGRAAVVAGVSIPAPIIVSTVAPTPTAPESDPKKDDKKDKNG